MAKPAFSALVMTAPFSLGQIRDSGPTETEARAELEMVEEPVAVEFWDTEAETDIVLAMLEELELELRRDSTVANVIPAAKRLVDLSMEL